MEQGASSSKQLMQCFCIICRGLKWWSKSTVYKHLSNQVIDVAPHDPSTILEPWMMESIGDTHMQEEEDTDVGDCPSSCREGSPCWSDLGDKHMQEEKDTNVGDCQSSCPEGSPSSSEPVRLTPQALTLQKAITCRMVELQSMWDDAHVSIKLQGHMLHQLFGCLEEEPKVFDDGSIDHSGLTLGKLLTLARPTWRGELEECDAPSSWGDLKKFYSSISLIKAQRWRLCRGSKEVPHSPKLLEPNQEDIYKGGEMVQCQCIPSQKKYKRDCAECSEKCPVCQKMRKTTLAFEYMPIGQILKSLCKSRSICHKLLTTWRSKEKWLGKDPSVILDKIEENFDGAKFRELQAFFDPEGEWEAPVVCPNKSCLHAYKAFPTRCDELLTNWDEEFKQYSFPCSECSTRISPKKKLEKGDPRNFSLVLHWDGFSTAKTSSKNCWAVNLIVLNARKLEPVGPIPILFIPTSSEKLIKSGDGVLMSFIQPLITDLEAIYVNGFKVVYNYPVELISDKLPKVCISEPIECRAILSIWTGDHPAQTKIGGWKLGGYSACRRHKILSRWRGIPNTKKGLVEYYDNRQQYRTPPPIRIAESTASALEVWRELPHGRERDMIGREAGISGYSSLWRLYNLYGFDLVRDLVYKIMHVLSLCIFKKYVLLLIKYAEEIGKTRDIDLAMATVKKLRPVGFGARWPRNVASVGYYKAEEYQIFIMWCLPHILDHLNLGPESVLGASGMLLTEIGRLFYIHSRRHGWTSQGMQNARQFLAAWHIMMEESVGHNSSPLEHVAGSGELLDDILRHGGHDIFWCYSFEREVSNVINIPSNQVNSEVTYSNYFSRYWFTKIYKSIQVDGDGLFPGCRALVQVHKYLQPSTNAQRSELLCSSLICEQWHASCIIVTPQDVARALWKLIPTMRPCFCKELIKKKGILIGQKKGLDSKVLETERLYLLTYWSLHAGFIEDLLPFFSASIQVFPSLLLHGQVYRVNDLVVIKPDGASSSHSWTWKAKVRKFFVHEFQGLKQVFFEGEYYVTIPSSSSVAMALEHDLTGMQVVQKDHLQEWCDFNVRLVEQIMLKIMALFCESAIEL